MNHSMMARVTCLFLLLSLVGFSIADEAPEYTLYMQGGESSITKDADGVKLVKIQDVVPYIGVEFEKEKKLLPVRDALIFPLPMNAALIFSGTDGDSVSLVQISNLSLSDENKVLTMQIKPLEFYDGELLKAFASELIGIENVGSGVLTQTGVVVEIRSVVVENAGLEGKEVCYPWEVYQCREGPRGMVCYCAEKSRE